ncbi:MAG: hypothetical protein WEB00_12310 [Dehalococcoidia bacterium]
MSQAPRIDRQTLAALELTKILRRKGRPDHAEGLLLELIRSAEAEPDSPPVEHWFYEHLAVLYMERGNQAAAVEVIDRYLSRPAASAKMRAMMEERRAGLSDQGEQGQPNSQ